MSLSNYEQLLVAAENAKEALKDLQAKTADASSADMEIVQAQAGYDLISSEYEKRLSQLQASEAEKAAVSSLLEQLVSRREALKTEKSKQIAVRDEQKSKVEIKEVELAGIVGEAAVPGSGSSTGLVKLREDLKDLRDELDVLNQNIVTGREKEINTKSDLTSDDVALKEMIKLRDAMAPDANKSAINATILAAESKRNATKELYDNIVADIKSNQDDATVKKAEITSKETEISSEMAKYRAAEVELETYRESYRDAVNKTLALTNELQDIEGIENPNDFDENVDTSNYPNGKEGSRLHITKSTKDSLDTIVTQGTNIKDSLSNAKDEKKDEITFAQSSKAAVDKDLVEFTSLYKAAKAEVDSRVEQQIRIEINAALAVLEDFLANGSIVASGAPVVSKSVEEEVVKTCNTSKVRNVLARIRTAYSDPAEYRRIRDEILADVVGTFFGKVDDPCYSSLSQSDVDRINSDMKRQFSLVATAALVKYGLLSPHSSPTKKHSPFPWFWLALLVIAIVIFVIYSRM